MSSFQAERKALKKDGNIYTGSGNFYESGQIQNAEGGVVATYVQFSIDDLQHRQLAAIAAAVDPIPMATLEFFQTVALHRDIEAVEHLRTTPEEVDNPFPRLTVTVDK